VDAILGCLCVLLVEDHFEVHIKGVNSNLVGASVILQGTGQETVSEEEQVDVEDVGDFCV